MQNIEQNSEEVYIMAPEEIKREKALNFIKNNEEVLVEFLHVIRSTVSSIDIEESFYADKDTSEYIRISEEEFFNIQDKLMVEQLKRIQALWR